MAVVEGMRRDYSEHHSIVSEIAYRREERLCPRSAGCFPDFVEEPSPELQRVRALVLRHGWNATAYQIINPGIRHWFPPDGDGVVGFVDAPGFHVVAGAPVCPVDRLPSLHLRFEQDAARERKRVCYFGAESRLEKLLCGSPRYSQVLLGAQPSFTPAHWDSTLRTHSSLRGQLNRRSTKASLFVIYPQTASADLRIRGCLIEWLASRGLPPLHFLIEPETLERLYDRRIFVAELRGEPVAFLHCVTGSAARRLARRTDRPRTKGAKRHRGTDDSCSHQMPRCGRE